MRFPTTLAARAYAKSFSDRVNAEADKADKAGVEVVDVPDSLVALAYDDAIKAQVDADLAGPDPKPVADETTGL